MPKIAPTEVELQLENLNIPERYPKQINRSLAACRYLCIKMLVALSIETIAKKSRTRL